MFREFIKNQQVCAAQIGEGGRWPAVGRKYKIGLWSVVQKNKTKQKLETDT